MWAKSDPVNQLVGREGGDHLPGCPSHPQPWCLRGDSHHPAPRLGAAGHPWHPKTSPLIGRAVAKCPLGAIGEVRLGACCLWMAVSRPGAATPSSLQLSSMAGLRGGGWMLVASQTSRESCDPAAGRFPAETAMAIFARGAATQTRPRSIAVQGTGAGMPELVDALAETQLPSPLLYPSDQQLSDTPEASCCSRALTQRARLLTTRRESALVPLFGGCAGGAGSFKWQAHARCLAHPVAGWSDPARKGNS